MWPDLSDIRSRVRTLLDQSSTRYYSDEMINRWINDGERDVAIKGLCIESTVSKTTTVSTRAVHIDCIKTLAIIYNGKTLTKIKPNKLGSRSVNGATPQSWFPWGNKNYIDPIPNAAYTLSVYAAILPTVEMSDDTDEPQVPEEVIPLIVRYAYWKALLRDRLYASSGAVYQDYIFKLSQIRDGIIQKYADTPADRKIPDTIEIAQ